MAERKQVIDFRSPPAPPGFGYHPDFYEDFRDCQQRAHDCFANGQAEKAIECLEGKQITVRELSNPLHPDVFVIPRNKYVNVVDPWGESIGFERMVFPFSSTDFYVDIDEEGIYKDLCRSAAFIRLGGISQLGYLVPPKPKEWDESIEIVYTTPQFHHTRWIHSLLVTILTDLIMARNGFSFKRRAPVILATGGHDIAIPAGGDSVKRVDPVGLDEEKNFSWVIRHYGLDKVWGRKFGFNLFKAQKIVENVGTFGRLLDFTDKIAYTALDCYFLGLMRPGEIRDFCIKHPLVMDVWQDIMFSDKEGFVFSDASRLFDFLLLRAYEFQEFLYNPYSRALDLYLKGLVKPLYEKGEITKEQLLTHDDMWLEHFLGEHCPGKIKAYIEPEELKCRKFETKAEEEKFLAEVGGIVDHKEHLTGFSSGLDWRIAGGGSLREAISKEKVELLEGIIASTRGYYVYYRV